MTPVEMPKANENLTEATLDRWLVKEGDSVNKDQALCEIITDKAKFEMPSPCAGKILQRFSPERSLLPVGFVMCVIGEAGEAVSADIATKNDALLATHKNAATSFASSGSSASPGSAVAGGSGIRATPAARRIAKEAGIDLGEIAKALNLTGPVNEKDVKTYLDQRK